MENLDTSKIDYFGSVIGWWVQFIQVAVESWWFTFVLLMVCVFLLLGVGFLIASLLKRGNR